MTAGDGAAGRTVVRARSLRRAMTEAEQQLWWLLRDRRLAAYKFRRQVPIGPYFADFACFDARLIVEADGSQHAESSSDQRRDAWFAARKFRVLRFWNNDILARPQAVLEAILSAVETPHPSPRSARRHLLPQGEKGGRR